MKAEIYNALAALNRGFDVVLESLTILQQQGLATAEYVEYQTVLAEELRAGINHRIHDVLKTTELEDWTRFARARITIEAKAKE